MGRPVRSAAGAGWQRWRRALILGPPEYDFFLADTIVRFPSSSDERVGNQRRGRAGPALSQIFGFLEPLGPRREIRSVGDAEEDQEFLRRRLVQRSRPAARRGRGSLDRRMKRRNGVGARISSSSRDGSPTRSMGRASPTEGRVHGDVIGGKVNARHILDGTLDAAA